VIPPAFIHDLLSRVDIVDVIGRHVQLRKAGINHQGLCPFHGEKTPSFYVSASRQTYHCFGCGVHGNAVGFLMEHTGVGFVEAVHDLAQQAGMAVPEDDRSPQERERAVQARQRQTTLTEVLAKAGDHYRLQLKQSRRAIDYLKGRGLTGEIAARFAMGYAPPGWRGLASVFPRYDDPLLEESGLVIAQAGDGEADSKRYDRFRDRIMFPIRSVQGEVIGFGGRVLDQGEPKYLNSPETPVFVKGRELYGLYEARTAMRQKGYVLVVEGYMDVVALAQLGFPNAVATLGTACTAEHVQKLFRFTDSVVFSFDGDAAGRRAAGRALEAALPHATDVRTIRFLFLPPEHDPDSYVREHGPESFEQCVTGAVPLSRQLLEAAAEGCALDTAEGRSRMLATAKPLWSALPDGALKRQIAADLASRGALGTDELLRLWGHAVAAKAPRSLEWQRAHRSPRRASPGTARQLDRALWLLVQRSDLWGALDGHAHDLLAGRPSPYDAFFACLERSFHEHGPLGREALLAELRPTAEDLGALPVLGRVAQLHDPEQDTDLARELAIVLDWLRLDDLNDDLQVIVESGELSAEMLGRFRELDARRAHLKASLTKP
jgi:DNA primase